MKKNASSLVKNEMLKSLKTKTEIAREIGISRTWLDQILAKETLEPKYIIALGKSLGIDFKALGPEAEQFTPSPRSSSMEELMKDLTETQRSLIEIQQKYIELLERYRDDTE